MSECWRCGRAVEQAWASQYVFGPVCNRADCRRVKQLLDKRFKWRWFTVGLPVPDEGDPGHLAAFTRDGEFQVVDE